MGQVGSQEGMLRERDILGTFSFEETPTRGENSVPIL
jgi:hypothetical protein